MTDIEHNLEAVREFQEDHVMTEAEAAALSDMRRREPRINITPCPERPKMTLVRTWGYKVELRTYGGQQFAAMFQVKPTADLIVQAVEGDRATAMAAEGQDPDDYFDPTYYDNLIQLASLSEIALSEIRLPEDCRTVHHTVRVAGVDVGRITIEPFILWAVRE